MSQLIPAFIINRNLLSWPKMMAEWMTALPGVVPIIYDNQSSYPPLLEWYDSCPYQVLRLPGNTWHSGIFYSGILNKLDTDYYIITDPDLDLSSVPLDIIDKMKYGLNKYPEYGKCGVALHTDDLPDGFPGKYDIINWESKYWTDPLDDLFYRAHVDTTFALYDASRLRSYTYEAIRIAGPYTARHIPWYITKDNISSEFKYYCAHNEGPATICGYCQEML